MRLTEEEKAEATALIRDAASNMRIFYQCCFCKLRIADVTALILIDKWTKPEAEQHSQQWFCHTACFEHATGERFDAMSEARQQIEASERAERQGTAKWRVGGIEVTPEEGKAAFRAALGPHKGE